MDIAYKKLEREYYYSDNGKKCIVKVYTGKEMYNKLKKDGKNYSVYYNNEKFSFDILKSDSCSEDFFFVSPVDSSVIVRCYDYDDTWYSLCVGRIKRKTYKVVSQCLNELYNSFNEFNLITFIRKQDNFYHLDVDGVDYGYLGDDLEDLIYKNMLVLIFKDVKCNADVVVLPSKGDKMFFSDNVAVYKDRKDFYKSILSRKSDSVSEVAVTLSESILDSI